MICAQVDDKLVRSLIKGYKKQVKLYRSMLEITQMQNDGLRRRGDVREFVSLLKKKEDIIRSIDKLDNGLKSMKREWQKMPEEDRKAFNGLNRKLNRLLDNVIVLIEKIMRQERENERILKSQRNELGEELAALSNGRRVHKSFAKKHAPKFIDTCR